MKKLLLVTALSAFSILITTSAFAQEVSSAKVSDRTAHFSSVNIERAVPEKYPKRLKRWLGELYITDLRGPSETCGVFPIRNSYFRPPGGSMTVSESSQASYGGNTSLSAEVISASVNFNVTDTFTVSDTQNIQVPSGKTANVKAHLMYDSWNFDVYQKGVFSDSRVGYGNADKPSGVCFRVDIK